MPTFEARFKKLRNSVGLTVEQTSRLLGVSETVVDGLETGYIQPNMDTLLRIAEVFNVSLKYLIMMQDIPKTEEPPSIKEIFVAKSASGADASVLRKDIAGTVYMDRDKMHGKEYFAFMMTDNAMAKARIQKGDTLIVRRQNYADNGEIVVAKLEEDEVVVRRYRRVGNVVVLNSEGDNFKYPPIKINTDVSFFKIMGVVREVRFDQK